MPNLNQTGPEGQGPATGRKMGKCANAGGEKTGNPPTENPPKKIGRGLGLGRRAGGHGQGKGKQNRLRGGN
jgi:hypothetical protein